MAIEFQKIDLDYFNCLLNKFCLMQFLSFFHFLKLLSILLFFSIGVIKKIMKNNIYFLMEELDGGKQIGFYLDI